jgi:hypothetical protein
MKKRMKVLIRAVDFERYGRLLSYLERWAGQPLRGLLTEIKTWHAIPEFADDLSRLAIEMAQP